MRLAAVIAVFALSACATDDSPSPAPVPQPVAVCIAADVVEAGRTGADLPEACDPKDVRTRDRYAIGKGIARIDEELADVNYRVASRDGGRLLGGSARIGRFGAFDSSGVLISRRVELKNARAALYQRAGVPRPQ